MGNSVFLLTVIGVLVVCVLRGRGRRRAGPARGGARRRVGRTRLAPLRHRLQYSCQGGQGLDNDKERNEPFQCTFILGHTGIETNLSRGLDPP